MYSSPVELRLMPVTTTPNLHHMRWTVDTREDLEFARQVFKVFDGRNDFSWREVVELLASQPLIAAINSGVQAKALELG
jgi:spore coat polysaccharide biosynthesis protein SpsF (cytidylyltransferase family)